MKYIALIYSNPESLERPNTPEFGKMMAGYDACNKAYAEAGVYVGGNALQPPMTATTVRVRGGKTETMDGPFAETKEQLGGFYILDCKDLDEAVKFAAMIPHAASGAVEVRPLMIFDAG